MNDPRGSIWWKWDLHVHQARSGPKMAELENWLTEQIEQHRIEPNSSLGEASSCQHKRYFHENP